MIKSGALKFLAILESLRSLTSLLIRLGLGWVFVVSGWGKLNHLPKVIEYFQSLNIPAPQLQAPFVAGVELVGGAAIILGLGARVASLLLASTMVVALITAKAEDIHDFSSLWEISEFLYILLFAVIATYGPGKLALEATSDRLWKL